MRKNSKMKDNAQKQNVLAILRKGQKLAIDGNIGEALRLLRRGISVAKERRDKRAQSLFHSEMGLCFQEMGRQKQALREFARAHHAWPDSSSSLLTLGTAYLDQSDLAKAGQYLTQALAVAEKEYRKGMYAKDPSNLLNTCLILSKASRELATKTLQFALKTFPNHPLLKKELQAAAGS